MSSETKIAIIGGSKEANDLTLLLGKSGIEVNFFTTETYPAPVGVKSSIYTAKTNWCDILAGASAIVIAPHPFEFPEISTPESIPVVSLRRPEWIPTFDDKWTIAKNSEQAALLLAQSGSKRPLLAIGRERLEPFNNLASPDLLVRCRTKPIPELKAGSTALYQPGPFTVQQETDFLLNNNIDCIVVHNAGGQGGWPKLEAARKLGIPVIIINRPQTAWKNQVSDVKALINWLRQHVGLDV